MIKTIFTLSLILLLTGCNHIDFDSYFPTDQKAEIGISPDFTGNYYLTDSVIGKKSEGYFYNSKYYFSGIQSKDSILLFTTVIRVNERMITYSVNFADYYKLSAVDTARINRKFHYKDMFVEGAHLVHKESLSDTLLNLDKKDKLFFYKSKYYINHYQKGEDLKSETWGISQFEELGKDLYSFNMTSEEDYKMLFDTTKEKPVFPVAHITNEQFKTFVAKGGFQKKYRLARYTSKED
jgi:hypothetical protein